MPTPRFLDDDDDTFGLDRRWASNAARTGFGRIEPDEQLEAFRDAWRRGSSYEELFGTDPFDLKARVGDDGENRPSDVAKLQTLLDRLGFYDLRFTDGPTGLYSSILGDSLKTFQAAADLKVDGIADPGGETIRTLRSDLTPDVSAREAIASRDASPVIAERTPKSVPPSVGVDGRATTKRAFLGDGEEHPGGYRRSPLPPHRPTSEMQQDFEQKSGLRLKKTASGFELVDPANGKAFAEVSQEAAAYLMRDWPWFSDRVWMLSVVNRPDLTKEERLAAVDRLLPSVDAQEFATERASPLARQAAQRRYQEKHRKVEGVRRALYDAIDALEQGTAQNKVPNSLRETLLPELFGPRSETRNLFLDVLPPFGNLRNIVHVQNEIAELREKIEKEDWLGAVGSGLMTALIALGIAPPVATAKAGIKVFPYGDSIVNQVKLTRMAARWNDLSKPINPSKLFGKHFDGLGPQLKKRVVLAGNRVLGAAGEDFVLDAARRVDPLARRPEAVTLPKAGRRTYDLEKRDFHEVVVDDVRSAVAKLSGALAPKRTRGTLHEIKTGAGTRSKHQTAFDNLALIHPDAETVLGPKSIGALRVLPSQLPPHFVLDHAASYLSQLVRKGKLPQPDADALMKGLKANLRSRGATVRTLDYVAFLSHLAATGERHILDPWLNQ